jgi:hypothetical protein
MLSSGRGSRELVDTTPTNHRIISENGENLHWTSHSPSVVFKVICIYIIRYTLSSKYLLVKIVTDSKIIISQEKGKISQSSNLGTVLVGNVIRRP